MLFGLSSDKRNGFKDKGRVVLRLMLFSSCLVCLAMTGCQTVGYLALNTANGIAALGDYRRVTDLSYGPHERHRLDIYTPGDARNDPRPVVIFFHGGDWSEGYPGKESLRFVGDALTNRGFVAVVANYRRYPDVRFPAFVDDGAAAVVWTRHNIAEFGGDPDRLFVMGHSAGGHTATMIALNPKYMRRAGGDPRWISGVIGIAAPYAFLPMPDEPLLHDLFGPPERYELSQVINYVREDQPPLLLMAGTRDTRVPLECARRLEDRVRNRNQPVEVKTYKLDHIMMIASLAAPVRWNRRAPVIDDIATFVRVHADASDTVRAHVREPTVPSTDAVTTLIPDTPGEHHDG